MEKRNSFEDINISFDSKGRSLYLCWQWWSEKYFSKEGQIKYNKVLKLTKK